MGLGTVPVIRIEGMTEAEKKAYVIADNRLAELAGWDKDLLRLELGSILEEVPDFDLEITGFDGGELEALLAAIEQGDAVEEVAAPEAQEQAFSEQGQVWLLGGHRLSCGDSRDPEVYRGCCQTKCTGR